MGATVGRSSEVQRKGRRVVPALRRTAKRRQAAARHQQLTVGELLVAALETSGGEVRAAVKLVTSSRMQRALGARIVFE